MLIRPPSGGIPGIPFDPISFGVELVLTILTSLFGLFKQNNGLEQLRQEAQTYREQMAKALDTANRFSWKVGYGLGSIITAVDHLWSGPIKSLTKVVQSLLVKLKDLAIRGLINIAKALHQIRKWMDEYYDKYARPVLKVIGTIRKYLAILRLFHVKFADKLDAYLVKIQGKITAPYLYILRTLNGYANWINVILTAGGHFQAPVFLRSAGRYSGYMQAIMLNSFQTPGGYSGSQPHSGRQPLPGLAGQAEEQSIINGTHPLYTPLINNAVNTLKQNLGV